MIGTALQKASAPALVVCLLLALPADAKLMVPRDLTDVTVVLAGGWEYPGLTVRWDDDADGLWVHRADGARRLYRPEELTALRDAGGRDVTREVIPASVLGRLAVTPGSPAPPTAAARPAKRSTPSTSSTGPAQIEIGGTIPAVGDRQRSAAPDTDWHFLLGVEAGWGKPHDTDFLDSEGGLGVGARVRLQLGGSLYLAGGYDVQTLPTPHGMVLAPIEAGDVIMPTDTFGDFLGEDEQLRGAWAGLSLISPGDGPEAARFYLEGGVGRYEVKGIWVMNAEDAYLGYHAGVGFLIPVGTAAALDLGARGTHVVNLDLGYGDDRHTVFAFRAGLSILAR